MSSKTDRCRMKENMISMIHMMREFSGGRRRATNRWRSRYGNSLSMIPPRRKPAAGGFSDRGKKLLRDAGTTEVGSW